MLTTTMLCSSQEWLVQCMGRETAKMVRWRGGWNGGWRMKIPWATMTTTATMYKQNNNQQSVMRVREHDWEWETAAIKERKIYTRTVVAVRTFTRHCLSAIFVAMAFVWHLWRLALFLGKSVRRERGSKTDEIEWETAKERNTQTVMTVRTFARLKAKRDSKYCTDRTGRRKGLRASCHPPQRKILSNILWEWRVSPWCHILHTPSYLPTSNRTQMLKKPWHIFHDASRTASGSMTPWQAIMWCERLVHRKKDVPHFSATNSRSRDWECQLPIDFLLK
jgi:hypothetical protein